MPTCYHQLNHQSLTSPSAFLSKKMTGSEVKMLMRTPIKVIRFGANHRGSFVTSQHQKGCINTCRQPNTYTQTDGQIERQSKRQTHAHAHTHTHLHAHTYTPQAHTHAHTHTTHTLLIHLRIWGAQRKP